MNILDMQDKLKNFSQDQLVQEMQMPTGQLPQFLLLNEITRRKKMQDSFAQQQGQEETTVAQDAINAAGMPQGAAQQLAGTMAPQTDMAANNGAAPQQMMPQAPQPVQGMAGGGIVALRDGGPVQSPRLVVRDGRQFAEMPDGSLIPLSELGFDSDEAPVAPRRSVNPSYDEDRPDRFPSISDVAPMSTPATPAVPGAAADMDAFQRDLVGAGRAIAGPPLQALDDRFGDTVFTPRPSPQRMPNEGPARFSGLDERLNRVLYPNDPDYGDPFRQQVMDDTADPYAAVGGDGVPPVQEPGRQFDINRILFPLAGTGAGGEFVNPEGALPTGERAGGGFRLVDPEAAPYESLERFLFPGRDPAEIRERRLANRRPPLEPDQFQEVFTMDGTPAAPPPMRDDVTTGPGEGLEPITGDDLLPGAPSVAPAATPPGGGGIASVAQGAASPSDFEQELMTMLAAREKRAEQDKWLALAQAGMQLMSSTQPTFGGALGEAGAAGLGALREGQAGSEADRLGLLSTIEQSRMGREKMDLERQALAARMASGGGGGDRRIPVGIITPLMDQLQEARAQLSALPPPPSAGIFSGQKQDPYSAERSLLRETVDQLTDTVNAAGAQYGISLAGTGTGAGRRPLN